MNGLSRVYKYNINTLSFLLFQSFFSFFFSFSMNYNGKYFAYRMECYETLKTTNIKYIKCGIEGNIDEK